MTVDLKNNPITPRQLWWRRFIVLGAVVGLGVMPLVSCLDEPEIDERWTKIEMLGVTPQHGSVQSADQPLNIAVDGRITYRAIRTGFLVAEVRYSDTIVPSDVVLDPDVHTLEISQTIDNVLANSVTAGRATRAITGFDHLMQDINLSFTAQVPAAMFPLGTTPVGGLFLVLYVGSGDEIQLSDGSDSLVVTPFVSTDKEILHTGFGLNITPPGTP